VLFLEFLNFDLSSYTGRLPNFGVRDLVDTWIVGPSRLFPTYFAWFWTRCGAALQQQNRQLNRWLYAQLRLFLAWDIQRNLVAFSAFRFSVAAKKFCCDIFGVGDGNFAIGKELFSVNCLVVRSGGGCPIAAMGIWMLAKIARKKSDRLRVDLFMRLEIVREIFVFERRKPPSLLRWIEFAAMRDATLVDRTKLEF